MILIVNANTSVDFFDAFGTLSFESSSSSSSFDAILIWIQSCMRLHIFMWLQSDLFCDGSDFLIFTVCNSTHFYFLHLKTKKKAMETNNIRIMKTVSGSISSSDEDDCHSDSVELLAFVSKIYLIYCNVFTCRIMLKICDKR